MKALNITEPFATLIARGIKKVETRKYAPPARYIGKRIALVGMNGAYSSVVGTATLDLCGEYTSEHNWTRNFSAHCVPENSMFSWQNKAEDETIWWWRLTDPSYFKEHVPVQKKRGRIWFDIDLDKAIKDETDLSCYR